MADRWPLTCPGCLSDELAADSIATSGEFTHRITCRVCGFSFAVDGRQVYLPAPPAAAAAVLIGPCSHDGCPGSVLRQPHGPTLCQYCGQAPPVPSAPLG